MNLARASSTASASKCKSREMYGVEEKIVMMFTCGIESLLYAQMDTLQFSQHERM